MIEEDVERLERIIGQRTAALRKLAAYAVYAVDGFWPAEDPFDVLLADHYGIDALCGALRRIGDDKAGVSS